MTFFKFFAFGIISMTWSVNLVAGDLTVNGPNTDAKSLVGKYSILLADSMECFSEKRTQPANKAVSDEFLIRKCICIGLKAPDQKERFSQIDALLNRNMSWRKKVFSYKENDPESTTTTIDLRLIDQEKMNFCKIAKGVFAKKSKDPGPMETFTVELELPHAPLGLGNILKGQNSEKVKMPPMPKQGRRVENKSKQYGLGAQTQNSNLVVCESTKNARIECPVRGPIKDVEIHKQLSHIECIRGQNYDFSVNKIWVARNCAATFKIIRGAPRSL